MLPPLFLHFSPSYNVCLAEFGTAELRIIFLRQVANE
jgi:hypothetical protein